MPRTAPGSLATLLAASLLLTGACRRAPLETDAVARVGNVSLTLEEVGDAVRFAGPASDSTELASRFVDQWITDRLLEREAERRGLRDEATVQRRLREAERSILVSALLEEVFAEEPDALDGNAIRAYFESRRESFRLLEPYVRVRHLAFAGAEAARDAQRLLATLDTTDAVRWRTLRSRSQLSDSTTAAYQDRFVPLSTLFPSLPALHAAVRGLTPGRTSGVVADGDAWHVVQLVGRAEPGSEPVLAWVEDQVRERAGIEARKQMVTRLVQTLRNEALAGRVLDMR